MRKIIVVNDPKKWSLNIPNIEVVSSKEYLSNPKFAEEENLRVFNLSSDYSYQSKGYYVSLLAEARDHRVLPDVKALLDLRSLSLTKIISDNLDDLIQDSLKTLKSKEFVLNIFFGKANIKKYDKLSLELHKSFQVPYLKARFVRSKKKWYLQSVRTLSLNEISSQNFDFIKVVAEEYFNKKRYFSPREDKYQYSLAILVDEDEKDPPSDAKALDKFIDSADKFGIDAEIITADDFHRLPAFDALFIRQFTHVNNQSYRFARKAQSSKIAIVDYPEIILKCCNKVYLHELMVANSVRCPKTIIVSSDNRKNVIEQLGLPFVLKIPDSAFSVGVNKINSEQDFKIAIKEMFEETDLLLAQEYLYTDFDWRIGVLDDEAIYACKYYMARGHWQIYNWQSKDQKHCSGDFQVVPLELVPSYVLKTALKAANLISDKGLFGVDLKEIKGKAYVIEVNDNPSIDSGVEDALLGDRLYDLIMQAFLKRF